MKHVKRVSKAQTPWVIEDLPPFGWWIWFASIVAFWKEW